MKKILFIALSCLLSISSFSQEEELAFSKVFEVTDVPKASIYASMKMWVGEYYKSAKAVIELEDKDMGVLLCAPVMSYDPKGVFMSAYEGHISYRLKIMCKDNKFKVDFYNFSHRNLPKNAGDCSLGLLTGPNQKFPRSINSSAHPKAAKDMIAKIKLFTNTAFEDIEAYSKNIKSEVSGSDDW